MHSPFEILKKEPDGSFRWFEAMSDLESAKTRIKDLVGFSLSEYVVFDQRWHSVVPAQQLKSRVDARRE
jgi:hypothetical protein